MGREVCSRMLNNAKLFRWRVSAISRRFVSAWSSLSQPSLTGKNGGESAIIVWWTRDPRSGRWLERRRIPCLWLPFSKYKDPSVTTGRVRYYPQKDVDDTASYFYW